MNSTKTLITDLERFSSIVKAFLDQSHEQPNFLSWLIIMSPYCFFHSQTFSINFSLPNSFLSNFLLLLIFSQLMLGLLYPHDQFLVATKFQIIHSMITN